MRGRRGARGSEQVPRELRQARAGSRNAFRTALGLFHDFLFFDFFCILLITQYFLLLIGLFVDFKGQSLFYYYFKKCTFKKVE